MLCASVTNDEWENVYRFMYENLKRSPKFKDPDKWEEAMVTIAEYVYKHSIVSDPEINMAACLIQLGRI